jgi:hypothetical protein
MLLLHLLFNLQGFPKLLEDPEVEAISKISLNLQFVAEGLVCHARSFLGSIEASMKLGLVGQVLRELVMR